MGCPKCLKNNIKLEESEEIDEEGLCGQAFFYCTDCDIQFMTEWHIDFHDIQITPIEKEEDL